MNFTKQQFAAIKSRAARVCVDAGAGSGKTRILIERILDLLKNREATLDQLVAITFMEKAAAEMKDRLRRACRELAQHDDAQVMSFWREREREVEHARISTIHSFCGALLREHALHLGLDPDFTVAVEVESELLEREVVQEALHRLLEEGDAQALAIATELGTQHLQTLLHQMIAKRSLLGRIAPKWPLDDPEALVTAWHEAVQAERELRLRTLYRNPAVPRYLRKLRAFDGLCSKPSDPREQCRVQAIQLLEQITPDTTETEAARILQALQQKPARGTSKKNWTPEEAHKKLTDLQNDVIKFAGKCLEEAELNPELEAHAAEMTCALFATWRRVQQAFDAAKAAAGALDFDDLLQRTHAALRDHPALRERVAQGIRFLLVDEFQDTDGIQLEIARLLSDVPGGPALFIVGDAKQSIYYFRGAEVEVFREERKRAEEVLPLDQNFRSLPGVLEFVNDFFQESHLLAAVGRYKPMAAHRPCNGKACVEFLASVPPDGHTGHWRAGDYCQHEAALVAARIAEICGPENGITVCDRNTDVERPAEYGDIALLFRAMSEVYVYEQALRERGIPYVLLSGGGFYTQQEVLDMLNLLRVVLDPWDEPALLAFLRSPMACLSDDALVWLTSDGQSLAGAFAAAGHPPELGGEDATQLQEARALIAELRGCMLLPLAAFLRRTLDRTGYEAVLLSQFLGVQKVANVRKLVDLADSFSGRRPASLRAFVGYLREVQHGQAREAEATLQAEGAGAVTLLTIHKAKGLEYPVVIVPQMSKTQQSRGDMLNLHRDLGLGLKILDNDTGEWWTSPISCAINQRIEDEEGAEHARLLYVALTRARDYLILCGRLESPVKSWYEAICALYGVPDLGHGGVIKRSSWKAVLRTRAEAADGRRAAPAEPEPLDRAALQARVAPVQAAPPPRAVISVSALLNAMTGTEDAQEAPAEAGAEDDAPGPSVSPGRARAMARGSLAHALLEQWDFRTDTPPDLPALVAGAGMGLGHHEKLLEELAKMLRNFRAMPLHAQLREAHEVLREVPFFLPLGEAMLSGTVDALLPDGSVVDYKTGRYTPEHLERYELQLRLYAAAVHALRGQRPPRGLLCFLDTGKQHEVSLGEAEVKQALRRARETAEKLAQQGKTPAARRVTA